MTDWRPRKEILPEQDTGVLFSPGRLSADLTEESSTIEIVNHSISSDESEIRNLDLLALDLTLCLRSRPPGHCETEDVPIGPLTKEVVEALDKKYNSDADFRELVRRIITQEFDDHDRRRYIRFRNQIMNNLEAGRASSTSDSDEDMDEEVGSNTQDSAGTFCPPQVSGLHQSSKADNDYVSRPPVASIEMAELPERSLHPETAAFFLPQIQELLLENRRLRNELNEAQSDNKVLHKKYRDGDNGSESSRGNAYEDTEDSEGVSESKNGSNNNLDHGDHESPLRMIYAHLVACEDGGMNYFEDRPQLFKGDFRKAHLRGRRGINLHLSFQHPSDITFAVIKRYECSCGQGPTNHHVVGYEKGRLVADASAPDHTSEHIWMNDSLLHDLQTIIAENTDKFQGFASKGYSSRLFAPYLLFYMHNTLFMERIASGTLEPKTTEALSLLCTWLEDNWRSHWNKADEEFSRGKVTREHYPLLFRPHELFSNKPRGSSRDDAHESFRVHEVQSYPWTREGDSDVDLTYWNFNGLFHRVKWSLSIPWELAYEKWDGEKDITSLRFFPLRFLGAKCTRKLVLRGHQFWKCRKKRLVAYTGNMEGDSGREPTEPRFMVDYDMLRRMHPKEAIFGLQGNDLGEQAMANDEPPDDDFLAMMPSKIHAFELATKAWKEISVDRITEVSWNKDAFKHLVIAKEDKELIEAVITAHGNRPISSPDIIAGKGQGLLILLHGGPGTGKTLTAESIAEAQERPLYRVTCGDIGIEPTEAESYLQTVLTLGETWGCVILIDEADVFLEERNIADQKQNAFVSVFLRLLEYYNGTVILTTNRVGTFDEAFKSRIHLALKYQNLDEEQRAGIWRNFIDTLRRSKDLIDVDDLKRNLPKLAQIELNGRQIRNTLTIARYLAKFRKQVLVYKHIQDAVASVVKFDQYLTTLRGSDDHWARDARLR